MSVLSLQAFDEALRQWLVEGRLAPSRNMVLRPTAGFAAPRPPAAVITCRRWPGPAPVAGTRGKGLAARWMELAVQTWAQRVTGSFCGRTPSGTVLLMVPLYSEAAATVGALKAFVESAAPASGSPTSAGGWTFEVIGPLAGGTALEVDRQLAQAGWPVS